MTAGLAIAGGMILGAVAGFVSRRVVNRRIGEGAAEVAGPTGVFLFWFFTFVGIVTGLSILTPATLETLPRQVLGFLPRVLAAGLILLGAWAAAGLLSRLVRRGLASASGDTGRGTETAVRAAVWATGFVFAVAQLGIDTGILTILVAVIAGTLGLSFASLVGFGGREIAREVAAGRYLSRHIHPGERIIVGNDHFEIQALHPASLEVLADDGAHHILPYSHLLQHGFIILGRHPENLRD
jgi:hypothetical protein